MCQAVNNYPEFKYILENYKEICYNINNAKIKFNRENSNVDLMAVTKTVEPERINFAIENGITLLGENRVQEYLSKKDLYNKNADVHFIGHLQTNKVKYIVNEVKMIQSVDSVKLAREINRLSEKNNKVMDILVEVNIGNELSKSGVSKEMLFDFIKEISTFKNISVCGLMAIPPIGSDESVFNDMHELFIKAGDMKIDNGSMKTLSMGMSGDYELAIKHGSNLVRIGTKLFGARKYLEV